MNVRGFTVNLSLCLIVILSSFYSLMFTFLFLWTVVVALIGISILKRSLPLPFPSHFWGHDIHSILYLYLHGHLLITPYIFFSLFACLFVSVLCEIKIRFLLEPFSNFECVFFFKWTKCVHTHVCVCVCVFVCVFLCVCVCVCVYVLVSFLFEKRIYMYKIVISKITIIKQIWNFTI